jgi:uncharacterized protein (DUF983 family)
MEFMGNITCPLCGAPITGTGLFGQGKPFCTHCGWNLERAESALNANSRVAVLLAVGLGILAISLFWLSSNARGGGPHLIPALPILLFFVLAGGIPYWSYLSTKRAIAQARATPSLQGQAQPIPDAFLQRVQSLPQPRRVGFRFPGAAAGAVAFAFGMLILIMFLATAHVGPPTGHRNGVPFPYFALFGPIIFVVVVIGIVIIPAVLKEKRNRPLFQDGEVAAARVLAQRTMRQGKASYSQIDYEFQTSGGETIRNTERDLSGKVFEDMLIPVFYDPVNPSRCAALCASYSRLLDAEN